MREIKFKVWDKYNKEMSEAMPLFGIAWETYDEHQFIPLQYTGLKDKNGVEIYEGDIVEVKFAHGTKRSDVRFFEDFGVFALSEVPNYYVTTPFDRPLGSSGSSTQYKPYTWKTYRSIEVIGNIYENPELLP